MMRIRFSCVAVLWLFASIAPIVSAADSQLDALLAKLRAVGGNGAGHREATRAWSELARADAAQLPEILAGLDGAGPLAANWIRTAVDAIAERQLQQGRPLPVGELERFVLDKRRDARARRLAYEWLLRVDPGAQDRLIPGMLDDPNWELRRDAVARLIDQAGRHAQAKRTAEAIAAYQQALGAARERDQIDMAAQRLRSLGQKVDLVRQLGYVVRWKLIGPFADVGGKGFDAVYPPEKEIRFDAQYQGKKGKVGWKDSVCTDDYGTVDLNKGLEEVKEAAGYAAAEFLSDRDREVELRITSDNAVRLWLNGMPVGSYKIYHGGTQPDQYVDRALLRRGRNVILVKVCQNEITPDWARAWDFHLRVVDPAGSPVLSADGKR
jgi:hypothetical protein